VHDIWDYNGTLGAGREGQPLVFTAHRAGATRRRSRHLSQRTQDGWLFTPDQNRPATPTSCSDPEHPSDLAGVDPHKIRLFFDYQNHWTASRLDTGSAGNGTPTAPEAAHYRKYLPNNVLRPAGASRDQQLLFEPACRQNFHLDEHARTGVTQNTISITESSNNFLYHAARIMASICRPDESALRDLVHHGSHAFRRSLHAAGVRRQTDDRIWA